MNHSTELYHHGIKGQKHGVRNGPPYPLDYKDLSPEEKKEAKEKAIRSGNVKEAIANRDEFTDQELEQLKRRFYLNDEVKNLSIRDIKTRKQKWKEVEDAMDAVARFGEKSIKLYNIGAKIANGVNDFEGNQTRRLPILGDGGGNKKKKKK